MGFLYMYLLRFCAKVIAWFSIIIILAGLVMSGTYAYYLSKTKYAAGDQAGTKMFWAAIVLWSLAGIYLLVLVCLYKQLAVSIAILEAAADFVSNTKRIIFIPVIFFLIICVMFFAWIAGVVCLFSVGDIRKGKYSNDFNRWERKVTWDQTTRGLMYFMMFAILWGIAFLIACCEFIIIVATSTWYFSANTDVKGDASIW